jgi:hypothetical protein
VSYRKHGTWMNLTQNIHGKSVWPASTAVSTSSLLVSAEQSGHFTYIQGSFKIVGDKNREATVSPQTVQAHPEPDPRSGR